MAWHNSLFFLKRFFFFFFQDVKKSIKNAVFFFGTTTKSERGQPETEKKNMPDLQAISPKSQFTKPRQMREWMESRSRAGGEKTKQRQSKTHVTRRERKETNETMIIFFFQDRVRG